MSLLASVLDSGTKHLRQAGIDSPRLEARLLLAHALGATQEDIIAERMQPQPQALAQFEMLLRRRMAREPLAYIVGYREFWSLPFEVGLGVLVPRPESETLVEEALHAFPDLTAPLAVLDLGIGSGCLLFSFLSERPEAEGLGIDVSAEALAWAAANAQGLGVATRVQLEQGSWTGRLDHGFDVVFANPPYIAEIDVAGLAPELTFYEPMGALTAGADGLAAYRQIAAILAPLLKPEGRAFVELGAGQSELVSAIFTANGLAVVKRPPILLEFHAAWCCAAPL